MIVYQATKARYAPHAESNAWRESLGQMAKVLRDDEMPDDMGVGIEFGIPQSSESMLSDKAVLNLRAYEISVG